MTNRPAPIQLTLNSENWHLQIRNDMNQPILLTNLLQGQHRLQENQSIQYEQLENNQNPDITLDLSGSSGNVSDEEGNLSPPTQNSPNQSNTQSSLTTISQFLDQNPELKNILQTFLSFIPFLALILLKEIYKHTSDILVILALVATFIHGDKTLQREVTKQAKREYAPLGIIVVNVAACILLVHFLCGDNELYHCFLVFPLDAASFSLSNLIWAVIATDHLLKLLTVLAKTVITAIPIRLFPPCRRGKWYVFFELSSQVYRASATIPPWINYLFSSQASQELTISISGTLVGIILCSVYFTCKAYKTAELVKKWKQAWNKLLKSTNHGDVPTSEQLQAAGSMCPVCHENYRKPALLPCKHIFCEDCLARWLDRERTCPMCRSIVAEDPTWKDGSTTYFPQFF